MEAVHGWISIARTAGTLGDASGSTSPVAPWPTLAASRTSGRARSGRCGEKPLWRHTAKLLRSYLRKRRDVGPYLFTDRKGPLQTRQVQKLFSDYSKAAGIKERSVHDLRHSMAVHLLEAGRGIEYVADHLGHKNIQNIRIYAQITNPLREQVCRELEQHPKIVLVS